VLLAKDLNETWEHLTTSHVHVVIADQRIPGTQGSELLTLVRERFPQVQRMLITAYSDLEAIIDAVNNAGVVQYITKPWDAERILQAVMRAYKDFQDEEERTAYTQKLLEANQQLEFALRQRLLS
jgi:DNA-binding NtrC family response regulator